MVLRNGKPHKWTSEQINKVAKEFPEFFPKDPKDINEKTKSIFLEYVPSRIKYTPDKLRKMPTGFGLLSSVRVVENGESAEYIVCDTYKENKGKIIPSPGCISVKHMKPFNYRQHLDEFMFLVLFSPEVRDNLAANKKTAKVFFVNETKRDLEILAESSSESQIKAWMQVGSGFTDDQVMQYANVLSIPYDSPLRARAAISQMATDKEFQKKFMALAKDQNLLHIEGLIYQAEQAGVIVWRNDKKVYMMDRGDGLQELTGVPVDHFKNPKAYLREYLGRRKEVLNELNAQFGKIVKGKNVPLTTTIEEYTKDKTSDIKDLLEGREAGEVESFFKTAKFAWHNELKEEILSNL